MLSVRNWVWENGNLHQIGKAWGGEYTHILKNKTFSCYPNSQSIIFANLEKYSFRYYHLKDYIPNSEMTAKLDGINYLSP